MSVTNDMMILNQETFNTTLMTVFQQNGSKLRGTFREEGNIIGDGKAIENQLLAVTATESNTAFNPIEPNQNPADRRWIYPDKIMTYASFVSRYQDVMTSVGDPTSEYVVSANKALGRLMDDKMFTALFAPARTGQHGENTANIPAGNVIAVDVGVGSATGMNLDKLLKANQVMAENEIDTDTEQLFCIIPPFARTQLLKQVEFTSADFNTDMPLKSGYLGNWQGINFIVSNRVKVDGSGYYRIPFFVKSCMVMGIWQDLQTLITQRNDRADLGHPYQIYSSGLFGWTRTQDVGVIEIKCANV